MRTTLLGFLLVATLLPGCLAVAGGIAGGVLLSSDVLDNSVYVAQLDSDAAKVWSSVKVTLNHASLKPIEADEDLRKATAEIDGAKVTAAVETYDLDRSVLRVSAKKYGVNNGEIAKMIYDKIIADLER